MKRGGGRPKSLKCCEIDRKTYKLCKKAAHKLCELGTCHSPECRASVEEACAEEARALVLAHGEEPDAETLQNYNDIAVPGLQKSQKDYFLEQASKKKQEMEALVADVMRKKATALEEARTSEAAKRARAELEESTEKRRRVTAQTQLPPVDLSSQPLLSLSDPLGDLGLLPPLPSPADGGDEEGLGDGDERVELPPQPTLALPAPLVQTLQQPPPCVPPPQPPPCAWRQHRSRAAGCVAHRCRAGARRWRFRRLTANRNGNERRPPCPFAPSCAVTLSSSDQPQGAAAVPPIQGPVAGERPPARVHRPQLAGRLLGLSTFMRNSVVDM